jgi:tetratricopeptide (TPR) repeat protein
MKIPGVIPAGFALIKTAGLDASPSRELQAMTERSIFLAALEIDDPAQRAVYLDRACAGDPALRSQLEQLLKAHQEPGRFMERPAPVLVATVDEPVPERPGTVIGPYKLMEQIGEGGMGLVFVAEQQQPVRRKVALKVIKPGMDTRAVIARFEAERQALALMDHPNIAKVLDGGETAGGRPYFVMELVKGVPITEYCDQNQVPVGERLELFLTVCQAVQHAHQKGIIHRDIKPSNVLVMSHDGKPVVRVIDFGVAKAIGQRLTDKTVYTHFAQMIGTPLYMSPEQAGESSLDVDTRSDIYSLGVLLYELLTGTTPFDKEHLQQVGYDEMRRIIREEEPPKPSTRISTLGQAAATVSTKRKSDPKQLSRLIRGELDWIVMKALEKDRARRYETANGFARDVQRYLADEPVEACLPSVGYRLRKFTRKHKRFLATGAGIAALLLLAAAGGLWFLQKRAQTAGAVHEALNRAAELQKASRWPEALAEAKRAQELLKLGGGSADLRQRVRELLKDLEMVARVEDIQIQIANKQWSKGHFVDPEVLDRLYGEAFRWYGIDVEALEPAEAASRLGQRSIAVELAGALDDWVSHSLRQGDDRNRKRLLALARAVDPDARRNQLRDALEESDPKSTRQRLVQVAATVQMTDWPANTLHLLGATVRDVGAIEQAVTLLQQAQRKYPEHFWICSDLADCLSQMKPPQWDGAIRYYTAAMALRPRSPGAHSNLGGVLAEKGQLEEAIAECKEAIRLKPDDALAHNNLGFAFWKKHLWDEAIVELREALRLEPGDAISHSNLGLTLRDKGRLDEAIVELKEAIRLKPSLAIAHLNLGLVMQDKERRNEAIAEYKEAIRLNKDYADAYYNLGNALVGKGRLDEAIVEYKEAIRLKPDHAGAHNNLGSAFWKKHLWDEAIVEYREALRLEPDNALFHSKLGTALAGKGRVDEAIAEYKEAIRLKPDYTNAHNNLGLALERKGRPDEAIAEYKEAIRLKPDHVDAHNNLGVALGRKGLYDQAIAEFKQAIRIKKGYAEAHNNLGAALVGKGRLDEAIAEYKEAIRLNKDYADAHYNLANALAGKERLDEAIVEYKEAIRLKPDHADAHNNLGVALMDKGRPDEAIAEFREALRLNKDEAHLNLGLALMDKGRLDEAIAEFKQTIRLKPDDVAAHYKLGCALSKKGALLEAIVAYEEAIRLQPRLVKELGAEGDSWEWFPLAMAHWQLSGKEEARKWFDKAVQRMENNQPKNEELRRFRAEAARLLGVKDKKN